MTSKVPCPWSCGAEFSKDDDIVLHFNPEDLRLLCPKLQKKHVIAITDSLVQKLKALVNFHPGHSVEPVSFPLDADEKFAGFLTAVVKTRSDLLGIPISFMPIPVADSEEVNPKKPGSSVKVVKVARRPLLLPSPSGTSTDPCVTPDVITVTKGLSAFFFHSLQLASGAIFVMVCLPAAQAYFVDPTESTLDDNQKIIKLRRDEISLTIKAILSPLYKNVVLPMPIAFNRTALRKAMHTPLFANGKLRADSAAITELLVLALCHRCALQPAESYDSADARGVPLFFTLAQDDLSQLLNSSNSTSANKLTSRAAAYEEASYWQKLIAWALNQSVCAALFHVVDKSDNSETPTESTIEEQLKILATGGRGSVEGNDSPSMTMATKKLGKEKVVVRENGQPAKEASLQRLLPSKQPSGGIPADIALPKAKNRSLGRMEPKTLVSEYSIERKKRKSIDHGKLPCTSSVLAATEPVSPEHSPSYLDATEPISPDSECSASSVFEFSIHTTSSLTGESSPFPCRDCEHPNVTSESTSGNTLRLCPVPKPKLVSPGVDNSSQTVGEDEFEEQLEQLRKTDFAEHVGGESSSKNQTFEAKTQSLLGAIGEAARKTTLKMHPEPNSEKPTVKALAKQNSEQATEETLAMLSSEKVEKQFSGPNIEKASVNVLAKLNIVKATEKMPVELTTEKTIQKTADQPVAQKSTENRSAHANPAQPELLDKESLSKKPVMIEQTVTSPLVAVKGVPKATVRKKDTLPASSSKSQSGGVEKESSYKSQQAPLGIGHNASNKPSEKKDLQVTKRNRFASDLSDKDAAKKQKFGGKTGTLWEDIVALTAKEASKQLQLSRPDLFPSGTVMADSSLKKQNVSESLPRTLVSDGKPATFSSDVAENAEKIVVTKGSVQPPEPRKSRFSANLRNGTFSEENGRLPETIGIIAVNDSSHSISENRIDITLPSSPPRGLELKSPGLDSVGVDLFLQKQDWWNGFTETEPSQNKKNSATTAENDTNYIVANRVTISSSSPSPDRTSSLTEESDTSAIQRVASNNKDSELTPPRFSVTEYSCLACKKRKFVSTDYRTIKEHVCEHSHISLYPYRCLDCFLNFSCPRMMLTHCEVMGTMHHSYHCNVFTDELDDPALCHFSTSSLDIFLQHRVDLHAENASESLKILEKIKCYMPIVDADVEQLIGTSTVDM